MEVGARGTRADSGVGALINDFLGVSVKPFDLEEELILDGESKLRDDMEERTFFDLRPAVTNGWRNAD